MSEAKSMEMLWLEVLDSYQESANPAVREVMTSAFPTMRLMFYMGASMAVKMLAAGDHKLLAREIAANLDRSVIPGAGEQ